MDGCLVAAAAIVKIVTIGWLRVGSSCAAARSRTIRLYFGLAPHKFLVPQVKDKAMVLAASI